MLDSEPLALFARDAVRREQVGDERRVDERRLGKVNDNQSVPDEQAIEQGSDFRPCCEIMFAGALDNGPARGIDDHFQMTYGTVRHSAQQALAGS
jgi:hypothetical protein